ncbi:MAG: hypothetical protein GY853_10750 [PVC group bacterium]|nr:hypothetical protein [PVC group bacterium]
MSILLFLIIIIVSFVIVRTGAIAFELTGLKWSLAKFQALSCFTGTGFTTREAELITRHSQRREIASVLMILGNVGLVTLIATFVNTLRPDMIISEVKVPFLDFSLFLTPAVNLLLGMIVLFIIYKIFTKTSLSRDFTASIRQHLIKKEMIKVASFEELALIAEGYSVSSVEIDSNSPVLDKSIIESRVRDLDVTVLAIEREGKIIPNPTANRKLILDDKIICFGRFANVKKALCGK